MNLPFSKQLLINEVKLDTHFKEKILTCFMRSKTSFRPKLHSLRQDVHDRWKADRQIHFVYGNRSKEHECFKVAPCISVEHIAIVYPPCCGFTIYVFDAENNFGKKLSDQEIEMLALNDGFETVEDFKAYFNKDFIGKIIHWTDLKYAL